MWGISMIVWTTGARLGPVRFTGMTDLISAPSDSWRPKAVTPGDVRVRGDGLVEKAS